ncbi:AAA family ATPase [Caulobacter sp. CCG-8]|uniref:ATP-binding protein n=1 Tax=Caulobacter sp. CCG-8 TaxID=3127958 RepID=UPI00307E306B
MEKASASSERRIITVLAADMVGSTRHIAACDPDEAQAFLDVWFEHVSEAVERAGGLLVHYEGDGGIAVFGWPGALEDHADRACQAAWTIAHPAVAAPGPNGDPVFFRVGLHSGLVGLREIHRHDRPRFDVSGAVVHVAAKLQQRAGSGQVLISGEALNLCRHPVEVVRETREEALGELGVDAYRLAARPERRDPGSVPFRYRWPMVGRDGELAALRELFSAGGARASAALIGEAGIGKTRLAAAAVNEELAAGSRILTFQGDGQRSTTPFAAARELIERLGAEPGDLARGGLDEEEAAVLEAVVAPARREDARPPARWTPLQVARIFAKAFAARMGGDPILLLIEDLHLVDAESRQFLKLLATETPPPALRLLVTGRPEAWNDAGEIASLVLRLEPLGRMEMKALGRCLWPTPTVSESLLEQVLDRAEGVPFVLEELVRSVDAEGADAFRRLPQGVESAIHARLQRVSPRARGLAEALSLLGEEIEIDLAREVLGADRDALLDDLAELERFAFLHPATGQTTRFRHQIIAESCANTISRSRRRDLHQAALDTILARVGPALAGRYEGLSLHAEGAGDDRAALDYLWEAGLEARRSVAGGSLNLIFDRAVRVTTRIGADAENRFVDFVLMVCASMLQLGEFRKMNTHLPRAVQVAHARGRPDQVCVALSQLGMLCWFEGRYQEGLDATTRGLEMARAMEAPALIFAHEVMATNILHDMGRVDEAIARLKRLDEMLVGDLATARLGAPALPRATTHAFLSWFMNAVGRYAEGVDHAERALEIAVTAQDAYSEVLARSSLGRNLVNLGRDAEAAECLHRALDLAELNGYDAIKANLTGALATALTRAGRPHLAIQRVQACLAKNLHQRTGQLEVYYLHVGYAEALVRTGEVERGLVALEQALAIARAVDSPCLVVDGLGLRSRLLAELRPGSDLVEVDLEEQREICARAGLVAWKPSPARAPAVRPSASPASGASGASPA